MVNLIIGVVTAQQMNDIDGDNIWEFTTLVDTSLQEYKFS